MSQPRRTLVWFRADLRTADNTALHHACRTGDAGVVGVFTVCPGQWREHDWATVKVDLILRTLRELSGSLAELNIPLKILETPRFDGVPDALLALARATGCGALRFNREYVWNEARRDEAVTAAFEDAGLDVHAHTDLTLTEPGEVLTRAGGYYSVFTPFKRALYALLGDTGVPPVFPAPAVQPDTGLAPDPIPDSLPGSEPDPDDTTGARLARPDLWPAGETRALERLSAFADERIGSYHERRDLPAVSGTSVLSPYLTIGCLSPRRCLRAVLDADPRVLDPRRVSGPAVWLSELTWREFYTHLVVGFPRVSKHRAMKPHYDAVEWRDDDEAFGAWCAGRTGYPIIDAAMRQLNTTGWMHNRCRMIAAIFLCKDLLIDWRRGERYFMSRLVDGDLANNNGGWQWSASSGADAAPYFRIFNPVSQSKKFDPEGEYIRRFVPELSGVEGNAVHEPWTLPPLERTKLDYPDPIVDHAEARLRAIDAYKTALG